MPIIILLIFVILFFLFKYTMAKDKNKDLKKELSKKAEKEMIHADLTRSDKKFFSKIFNKKINYISYVKKIKHYDLFYRKGEFFYGGLNEEYDVIKISLRKVKVNGEELFNMDVYSWKNKLAFEREEPSDKKMESILTKKELFKQQVMFSLDGFFEKLVKEKDENTINIDND